MNGVRISAAAMAALALALSSAATAATAAASAQPAAAPAFTYDTGWMRLPPQWLLGDVSAVAVDKADNVWVLHRPRSLPADQRRHAAPPVLQFDSHGKFLRGWGGPGDGYDWPANEHSLFVDGENRVWLTGNSRAPGAGDDSVLCFTSRGRFLRQIGKPNASQGDADTANLKAPADLYVDDARRELYVADGYGNHRLIVFDVETGAFKRMWGAFGGVPQAGAGPAGVTPPPAGGLPPDAGSTHFQSVHGVELSRDGLVYVSDRDNRRIQVFDRAGQYKTQVSVHHSEPSRATASGLGLSPDKAQRWLYVVDFADNQIEVFDRKTLTPVADLGGPGKGPGQFASPHLIAVDSKGVIYVAEVQGRRVQRLVPR